MGQYGILLRVALILGITTACLAGGNPEDNLPATEINAVLEPVTAPENTTLEFSGRPDWVYQASDWVLNLYIVRNENKGKAGKKQGSHGILLFEGQPVQGEPGEVRALPIGTVTFQGSAESRQNLRDNSGWQMTDPLINPIVHTPAKTRIKMQESPPAAQE